MKHTRRAFLVATGLSGMTGLKGVAGMTAPGGDATENSQAPAGPQLRHVDTDTLSIAYEEQGSAAGVPVILLHGFPDDVRAWDEVARPLAAAGHRVLVPYLRGYGPTRFLSPATPRLAEQAAIGQDLIDFADALRLPAYVVCGYDWGGRAACIAAALAPDRVRAAVIIGGYTIQNTLAAPRPASPEAERALWYQRYFNTERGRAGLAANRHSFCKLLWQLWSPTWTVHRSGLRSHRGVVRQPRLRRRRHSLLPPSQRQRTWRSEVCRHRIPPGPASDHPRADDRAARSLTMASPDRPWIRRPSALYFPRWWRGGSLRAPATSCRAKNRRRYRARCWSCWGQRSDRQRSDVSAHG